MENKTPQLSEFSERILLGMRIAIRKLVETSAHNNESLIVGDKDGNPISVPAKDLLSTVKDYELHA
jgi:hypothetical protein